MFKLIDDPSQCIRQNSALLDYYEFSCLYPALEPFYMNWEKEYDPVPMVYSMGRMPWFPIMACAFYALFIVAGQKYFESRPRWNWKNTMAAWNLFLSTFSFIGVCRTLPPLIMNITHMSFRDNMCTDPSMSFGCGSTGLWVQLFILSKFPELIDTFFIVIHKKKLIFLHWYHHITVLLYCWHSYVAMSPTGLFFVVMNYAVHSSMYFYYFLVAIKSKPKWLNPMFITACQILQMVGGVSITLTGVYYQRMAEKEGFICRINPENNTAAMIMYGSYLFLFSQFFIGRYLPSAMTGKKQKTV